MRGKKKLRERSKEKERKENAKNNKKNKSSTNIDRLRDEREPINVDLIET